MEHNVYNSDLLGSMDYMYGSILSVKSCEVDICESEVQSSQFLGRWLGFILSFVCGKMEKELHKAQGCMDFPHNRRIANAIFKIGLLDGIEMPEKIFPYWSHDYVDNPLALKNIVAKMSEEERKIIEIIGLKAKINLRGVYDYDQVELGALEGMLIYLKHLPLLPKLAENILFHFNNRSLSMFCGGVQNLKTRKVKVSWIWGLKPANKLNNEVVLPPFCVTSLQEEAKKEISQLKELTQDDIRSALLNWKKSVDEVYSLLIKSGKDEKQARSMIDEVCEVILNERRRKIVPYFVIAIVLIIAGICLLPTKVVFLTPVSWIVSLFLLERIYSVYKTYKFKCLN